jgi:hypothetical protein
MKEICKHKIEVPNCHICFKPTKDTNLLMKEVDKIISDLEGYAYLEYFEGVKKDDLINTPYKIKMGQDVRRYLNELFESKLKGCREDAVRGFLWEFTETDVYEDCSDNEEVMKEWEKNNKVNSSKESK